MRSFDITASTSRSRWRRIETAKAAADAVRADVLHRRSRNVEPHLEADKDSRIW